MVSQVASNGMFRILVGCLILHTMCLADMNKFFPQINGDLTRVTWAHAVNSQSFLNSTLNNTSIMMIEADIVIGKKVNGTADDIPIMAHPPNEVSDLSLDEFMERVYNFNNDNNNTKGVKLDFKSFDAFNKSMKTIIEYNKGKFPLWINADILAGPTNASSIPVDADLFLNLCKRQELNNTVLSLGWTTNLSNTTSNTYNESHITEMVDKIKKNNITNEVTFAVRAALAANSLPQMRRLLTEIENSTLTIWMSDKSDVVNVNNLRGLIRNVTLARVYLDVPEELRKKVLSNGGNRLAMPVIVTLVLAGLVAMFS